MNTWKPRPPLAGLGVLTLAIAGVTSAAAPPAPPWFTWSTVVNNTDVMPSSTKNFNSYNPPSVNLRGLVVIRARSRGGPGDTGGPGNEGGAGRTGTGAGGGGGGSAGSGTGGTTVSAGEGGGGSGSGGSDTEHGNQPVHGMVKSDNLVMRAGACTLTSRGQVDPKGNVDFLVQAKLLRQVPILNIPGLRLGKMFEYKVGGTVGDPSYRPVMLPKEILAHGN